MQRSRASELRQRQAPRVPLRLRTNSEANSLHRTVVAAAERRAAKPEARRPARSPLHEIQKKRGTRATDLETELGKAQEELKQLRDQLAMAEAARLDAEQALEMAQKQIPSGSPELEAAEEDKLLLLLLLSQDSEATSAVTQEAKAEEESVNSTNTADVFQIVALTEPMNNESKPEEEEEEASVPEKQEKDEEGPKEGEFAESPEAVELKAKLLEKEKEVGILLEETVLFKTRAEEETARAAAESRAKEEELSAKLRSVEEGLKQSRAKAELLAEQLLAAEEGKATLEAEMKRLRVQTEQWRKAAEAAAEAVAPGYVEHEEWGPAMMAGDGTVEDGVAAAGGRGRKSGGVRMLGELWKKKKGHHHHHK